MRSIKIISLLLLSALSLQAGTPNEEFRATWSITWHQFWSSATAEQLKERTREILDKHVEANMNAVLWHVRQGGTVYYPSQYEPWGSYIGSSDPGYDPLAYAVEEAHKRGLELHAWFNTFAVSSTASGTPAADHPEWICRDEDGIAMSENRAVSPGMQAVRDYTLDLAMEIVNNYDVDGIHFDYIRWNEYSNSKASQDLARKALEEHRLDAQWTEEEIAILSSSKAGRFLYDVDHPRSAGIPAGYNSWEAYWRGSVNLFIASVHDSVAQVKPWVRVSAAALGRYVGGGWNGYESVYQDAALWFNQGWVDQLTPMHYHWTTADGFEEMLEGWNGWEDYIGPGIAAKRLYTVGPGSYILDDNNLWGNHVSIINRVRTIKWTDGFQFFSYGSWDGRQYWDEAGQTVFRHRTKIRTMPVLTKGLSNAPDAPALSISKTSEASYTLSVTPAAGTADANWFILYRQGNPDISPDTSVIVNRFFADGPFTVDLSFDGLQNYSGVQHYAVTQANRFWDESGLSPVSATEPLPLTPPRILSHSPAAGELLPLDASIVLNFNKSMDRESLEAFLEISPAAEMTFSWEKKDWEYGDRTVTLQFSQALSYDTEYTMTLGSSITDRMGSPVDGNGDGQAGDPFVWTFRTVNVDTQGPLISGGHPEIQDFAHFDQDDVLNLEFSELIDHESAGSDNIILRKGSDSVPIEIFAMDHEQGTVLSIKSTEPLIDGTAYELEATVGITDTSGNPLVENNIIRFSSSDNPYGSILSLDPLSSAQSWWDPEGSGSTTGTVDAETIFGYSSEVILPGSGRDKSAFIQYKWANDANGMLREHNAGTPATLSVTPDMVIQAWVYGDNSNNEFAFSFYEKDASGSNTSDVIEVSKWIKLSWTGWRLISWDLREADQVGDWISGHQNIDGYSYKLDGFLLRQVSWGADEGTIYISGLRAVERPLTVVNYTHLEEFSAEGPRSFRLEQNYPNPFNPSTTLRFSLSEPGRTRLDIYNIRGQHVLSVLNEDLSAGSYSYRLDFSSLSAGIYISRLQSGSSIQSRRMLYIK